MSGAAEFLEVVHGRSNHLIDPMHIWGWEIPVYLFLGGLAAGLLVLGAALEARRGGETLPVAVRRAPFAALALLSAGMVALLLDLEYPTHVLRFYLAFVPASPMSWGSWILILVVPVGLWLGFGLLTRDERISLGGSKFVPAALVRAATRSFDRYRRAVLTLAVIAGISLGAYTGLLLGTLGARPLWNSGILAPLFLVSGVSTAAAFLSLGRVPPALEERLSRWEVRLIATEIALVAVLLVDLSTGSAVAQAAASQLLSGPYTGAFWGLVLLLGLLVPLTLRLFERTRHAPPAAAASVLVLIGGLALRWVLVLAGQTTSFAMLP